MLDRREFLALGLAAAPALLFAGRPPRAATGPLALVTADTEAHVAVLALGSMRSAVLSAGTRILIRELRADAAPQHIAFGRAVAYLSSGDAGTVCVHALADGRLRRRTRAPAGSYNVEQANARSLRRRSVRARSVLGARGGIVAQAHVADAAHDVCLLP